MEKITVNKWELTAVFVILMVSGLFLYSNPEDPSFEETLAGKISSVAVLSDSSMVVTGNFAEGYAFKVTPDRKVDWGFMKNNEAGGFNGVPKVVKKLDGDHMLFGGNFTNYDQSDLRIVREHLRHGLQKVFETFLLIQPANRSYDDLVFANPERLAGMCCRFSFRGAEMREGSAIVDDPNLV